MLLVTWSMPWVSLLRCQPCGQCAINHVINHPVHRGSVCCRSYGQCGHFVLVERCPHYHMLIVAMVSVYDHVFCLLLVRSGPFNIWLCDLHTWTLVFTSWPSIPSSERRSTVDWTQLLRNQCRCKTISVLSGAMTESVERRPPGIAFLVQTKGTLHVEQDSNLHFSARMTT